MPQPIKNKILNIFFLLFLVWVPFGSLPASDQGDAIDAATQWLSLVDRGDYSSAWNRMSQQTHDHISYKKWHETVRNDRENWGGIKKRELDFSYNLAEKVRRKLGVDSFIKFKTTLSGNNVVEEIITLEKYEDGWRVVGYVVKNDT